MPTILVTTPGASNANSYAAYTDYTSYWNLRGFSTAALAAAQATVEPCMTWAAQIIDEAFDWTGMATLSTQSMAWPRMGMFTPNKYPLDQMTLPQRLLDAQCEFAGILLGADRTADIPDLKSVGSQTQLTGIKAGSVQLTFQGRTFTSLESFDAFIREQNSDFNYLARVIPDSVRMKIAPTWFVQHNLKRKLIFSAV